MMANPFDQFDAPAQAAPALSDGNPFDRFDAPGSKSSLASVVESPMVGFNRGLANTLGAPVDAANWAMRKVGLPVSETPFLGSESIKKGLGVIGANPDEHPANSSLEKVLQASGEGAASVMAPELGMAGLGKAGLASVAPKTAAFLQDAFGSSQTLPRYVANAGVGALSGAGGEAAGLATEGTPAEPYARLAGSLVGGGAGIAGSYAPAIARQAVEQAGKAAKPLYKSGVDELAGAKLRSSAENPVGVMDALENAPAELVPKSEPTTFQLTGDMGLGSLERQVAKDNPAEFMQRRAEQNAARVGALGRVQPEGLPQDVSAALRQKLDDLDNVSSRAVDFATANAQSAASRIGGAGDVEDYGAALRDKAQAAAKEAKAQRKALYDAVDPDNNLSLVAAPVRERAQQIASGIDPLAAKPSGEEASILADMQSVPDVLPFNSLRELESRITDAMSEERRNAGETKMWGRLSQLKNAVTNAIDKGVANQIAYERDAVRRNSFPYENTVEARLNGRWEQEPPANGAGNAGADSGVGIASAGPQTGDASLPARPDGTEVSASEGNSSRRGDSPLPPRPQNPGSPERIGAAIRRLGGINSRESDFAGFAQYPGSRNPPGLIAKNGMSADDMAKHLAGLGFLGEDAGAAGIIDRMNDELMSDLYGSPVYSAYDAEHVEQKAQYDNWVRNNEQWQNNQKAVRAHISENGGTIPDQRFVKDAASLMMDDNGLDVESAIEKAGQRFDDEVSNREAERARAQEQRGAAAKARDEAGRPGIAARPVSGGENSGFAGASGEPNFTEDAAQRLKAAKEAHADYAQTYRQGPVGDILKSSGFSGQYRASDASVPAKVFASGPKGYENGIAFRKAVGDDAEAVSQATDYAASSLRKAAERPDGTIDPAKFERWQKAHADALRAFPEIGDTFKNAASASEHMAKVAAAKKEALDAYQAGAIGKIIGAQDREEVVSRVGSIFGQKDAVAQMRRLTQEVKGNPEAETGLRKAVVDHIVKKFVSNTEAGTSEQSLLRSDQFQTFVRQNRAILSQVLKPEEVNAIGAIAADLQRSNRSIAAVKIPGQSNTAQDLAPQIKAASESHGSSLLTKIIGGWVAHGPSGAAAGIGAHILGGMRAAGMSKVDDLVKKAMLDPELALTLMKKAPVKTDTGVAVTLGQQLRRLATLQAMRQSPTKRNEQPIR